MHPWLAYQIGAMNEGYHLRNTDLGLRRKVDRDDLAQAAADYAKRRGYGLNPVDYLERRYMELVPRFLETGRTPMRCHALRSSCFVDSWGNVFPCTIWGRKIGSLRESDYDLGRIWNQAETAKVQGEIWNYECPQCWTPCEAYQGIMGNFLRPGSLTRPMETPGEEPARIRAAAGE